MKKSNLVLCSAIKGVLLNHGQPMAGYKIQRQIQWNLEQEPRVDYVITDPTGTYQFSELIGECEIGFFENLFHKPEVYQTLRLIQGDQSVVIFSGIRTHYLRPCGLEADCVEVASDLKNAIEVDPDLYAVKSVVKEYLAA